MHADTIGSVASSWKDIRLRGNFFQIGGVLVLVVSDEPNLWNLTDGSHATGRAVRSVGTRMDQRGVLMMLRKMLAAVTLVALVGAGAPAIAGGCKGCDKIAAGADGFCCGHGRAFGVKLTSKKLYEALSGVAYKEGDIKCPGCKEAAKHGGKCKHCKVAATHGKFYKSAVAYMLAKGDPISEEKASHCPGCKKAYASNGFCTGCNVGFVAGRMYKDKDDYEAALDAHKTLEKAAQAASHCEGCGIAMVLDGECEHCKVSFKNGKKVG